MAPEIEVFDAADLIPIRKPGEKKKSEDMISTLFLPDQYFLRILSSETEKEKSLKIHQQYCLTQWEVRHCLGRFRGFLFNCLV